MATSDPDTLWLRHVTVRGRPSDVLVAGDRIRAVTPPDAPRRVTPVGDPVVIDGDGAALLPGLADHHLHLLAWARARDSLECHGLATADQFAAALRAAPTGPDGWVRAVGYHEQLAGDLDRDVLDRLVPDRAVRVQHRGGALWVLNSAALAQVPGLEERHRADPDAERDAAGRLTGRLWRFDTRLRALSPSQPLPSLAATGEHLASLGITSVTDATPELDAVAIGHLGAEHAARRLPQRLLLLGAPDEADLPEGVAAGPRKLHLRDHDLPDLHTLAASVAATHARGRAVAVHCVTADALALTLAALSEVGVLPGDRIEHAAVVPPPLREDLRRLALTVVTQPSFVGERGDDYLRDVGEAERAWLYPWRSLARAGIPVAASSDAPHTLGDPWAAIRTASTRRTLSGAVLGANERVERAEALAGYLTDPRSPGGAVRRIEPGAEADLVLLQEPLGSALDALARGDNPVRLTVIGGRVLSGS